MDWGVNIRCTKMPISDQAMRGFQKRQYHLENKRQAKEKQMEQNLQKN